mmetsp:Transcript_6809/g.8828  ORF Transcript_6809/g.8828 Transcript_6809/m.8828 type:complete len:273 (-) Transcript_6809:296-1114(-)|eukprot:CAMPEP_0198143654 /NCGR_PEP_ID=MMETSP1443-20131203/8839_1 /TAXON_ID=186043 /ORGANISM="Entomoneis sp., Strain CCMP2396" /LENGTH=272 /DNA_ID=CAMNT_0043806921 /DNA_START=86 /DNA_END=904 /DNA_ORIENTATION=-
MKFRPCIDLHSGCVKQIVGSTLTSQSDESENNSAKEKLATNFSTDLPSSEFAAMYQKDNLLGGHVIMLGPGNEEAAKSALEAWPGGLQVGGGITDVNAKLWLDRGASHIIVTSFVFRNGAIDYERLENLVKLTTKERLILDLSCRRRPGEDPENGPYYVVTDKWQKFTDFQVNSENLKHLSKYCDEFLVHGVDVEGKQCGILKDLVILLGEACPIPVTYAGGVRSLEDMDLVNELGKGKVDCTVGSALDIFGGALRYDDVVAWHNKQSKEQS